jgi:hypothetical protein
VQSIVDKKLKCKNVSSGEKSMHSGLTVLISQLDIHLIKLFIGRGMFVVQRGQSNIEMYFHATVYSSRNTVLSNFCQNNLKSKIHIIIKA